MEKIYDESLEEADFPEKVVEEKNEERMTGWKLFFWVVGVWLWEAVQFLWNIITWIVLAPFAVLLFLWNLVKSALAVTIVYVLFKGLVLWAILPGIVGTVFGVSQQRKLENFFWPDAPNMNTILGQVDFYLLAVLIFIAAIAMTVARD